MNNSTRSERSALPRRLLAGLAASVGATAMAVVVIVGTSAACSFSSAASTTPRVPARPSMTATLSPSSSPAVSPKTSSTSTQPPASTTPPPAKTAAPTTRTPAPNTAGLRPVTYWEKEFLGSWDYDDKDHKDPQTKEVEKGFRSMSTSTDSWQFYGLAYGIDANVSMFQATGNTKYLDRALLYTNNVVNGAKPSKSISTSDYKDGYSGWGSFSHPDGDDNGREFPLYESYMFRYVTNMLVAMKQNPAVIGKASYKTQYDKILTFTERNVFDKWMSRNPENIYCDYTHMYSHWAMISLDLSLAEPDATKAKKYGAVHKRFDREMRAQLHKTNVGGYFWDAPMGQHSHPGQDVSHGNAVMAYVVHAHAVGNQSWTAADMTAFTVTLNKTIWPKATDYKGFVDGSGSDNGWFNDGFLDLGRFDGNVQKRLENHRVAHNSQFYASLALNAHLLGRDT